MNKAVNPGSNWYERGMLWAMEQGVTDSTNPWEILPVSSYAQSAVNWAAANRMLNGSEGKLNPKGTATRAQVAAIVMWYGEHIGA